MSSDRGRSWRPEKKVTARQSRRKQIAGLSALLVLLAGVALWLIFGPQVPRAQFVVVSEKSFIGDDTHITQLPPGSTAINAARLIRAAKRLHERDPSQVSEPVAFESVAKLIDAPPEAEKKLLVVYVTTAAIVAPPDTSDGKICVQFSPAGPKEKPVLFKQLLTSIRDSGSKRTVLLLELTGRNPALASGVLSDDLTSLLESELRAEKIPGLTLICACSKGERSWEFFQDKPVSTADPSKPPATGTPAITTATLPEFDGTVFGHFLISALEEGEAGNAAALFRYLKRQVNDWVKSHYKSSQTVWIVSSDDQSQQSKLLSSIKLPKGLSDELSDGKSGKDSEGTASESQPPEGGDSVAATPDGTPASGNATAAIDDRPVTLLQLRAEERDQLSAGTAPVQFPAEWLRLQMHMMAAERFAMNGNESEFNRIHDEVIKKSLTRMKGSSGTTTSVELDTIREWLLLSQVSAGIDVQFGQLLNDFGVEPGKAPPLPKELQTSGAARQAFAIELGKELLTLQQTIDTMPSAERIKRIQQLARLLENITDKGWRLNQFPESMATVKEVLQTWEQDPDALRLKPLVRLLAIRQAALQLAAGYGPDRLQLRRTTWDDRQVSKRIDEILVSLNSAERWLCVGPDAIPLANDQLETAEKKLANLQHDVNESQALSKVLDAQRLELPFLIEYLALRQESTSLPPSELKAACRMAESALTGSLALDEFPTGQLEPIEFGRDHLEAMFALTRVYSDSSRVSIADERHLNRLREYVNSRSRQEIPATERLQLLNIPQYSERAIVVAQLQHQLTSGIEDAPAPSGHSGIWLSFWSLRLADAITGQTQSPDWAAWNALVSAIDQGKDQEVSALRTGMSITLQNRWIAVMEKLKADAAGDVFVSPQEVLKLISREVSRRSQSSRNPNLFSTIAQSANSVEPGRTRASLTALSPEVTLSPDGSIEIPLRLQNISGLYLLHDQFEVLNEEKESRHDWSVLPVSHADGSEQNVTVRLRSGSEFASPVPMRLIGVNADGAAVVSTDIVVLPSSETEWSIEVAHVEEGKTTEQTVTLPDGRSRTDRILPLPPSTMDDAKKMPVPLLLKVRLRRIKGVAEKVRVRILPVNRQKAILAEMELSIPPGESDVIIPITPPPNAGETPAAAAAPVTIPETDITEGIVFEITPLDLAKSVATSLTLYPRLHAPDDMFDTPKPEFDPSTGKLVLRLERKSSFDSTKIWPAQFPGELVLNPGIRKFFRKGELVTPNADGFEFQAQFQQEIEKAIGSAPLEFGISLAGIPHAWWWSLEGPAPRLIRNEIRAFLRVENEQEVKIVARVPALLIGEGSRKAGFRTEIFLHGIQFDREQYLSVRLGSAGSDGSTPATDRPISVSSRFAESVLVSPGAGGIWKVTTKTSPYGIPVFSADTFRLSDGRHDLMATLQTSDLSLAPKESSVSFTLDESAPMLSESQIEVKQSPVLVTGKLKGRITVTDPESGVTGIRVGLKEDLMQELKFAPDRKIVEDFELDSLGFPKIEQKEIRNEDYGTLTVEVTNGVGLSKKQTKRITFFRPGKAVVMKEEPKQPGSIKVTFSIAAEFTVSVSGPDGYMDEKSGMSPVVFDNVPAGTCAVKWKPKQGTAGSGANSSVVVRSGKTTTVKGN